MASSWFSQLFINDSGGGVLLAIPFDAIGHWKAGEEEYEEAIKATAPFHLRSLSGGRQTGLFIGDDEGIHEAHFVRRANDPSLILAVWSAWDDPRRKTLPENEKKVVETWIRGRDPRQWWLSKQLDRPDLAWERY